jgi:hypothetical protein
MPSSLNTPDTASDVVQFVIISALVDDLLAAGFHLWVRDNDAERETHLAHSRDKAAILDALFSHEIDSADYTLDVGYWKAGDEEEADAIVGWVRLIDGNGATVMSDWSSPLEKHVAHANAIADEIDTRGEQRWVIDQFLKMEHACWLARVMVKGNMIENAIVDPANMDVTLGMVLDDALNGTQPPRPLPVDEIDEPYVPSAGDVDRDRDEEDRLELEHEQREQEREA